MTSSYLSIFIAPLLLAILQKKFFLKTLKKLLFLNVFILIMGISAVVKQDYEFALLIVLRANALIIFSLLIFSNKSLFDIAASLQTLKAPPKLIALFFFVGKFVIIIKNEFETTKQVMKIRNFKSKSNLFSYKIYANVIGMMIVKCFDRAEKLKYSMILRNFQGQIYQSNIDKFTFMDFLIFISVLASIFLKIGEISL